MSLRSTMAWSLYYVCNRRATKERALADQALGTVRCLARGSHFARAGYRRRAWADDLTWCCLCTAPRVAAGNLLESLAGPSQDRVSRQTATLPTLRAAARSPGE